MSSSPRLDKTAYVVAVALLAWIAFVLVKADATPLAIGALILGGALLWRDPWLVLTGSLFIPLLNLTQIETIGFQPERLRWAPLFSFFPLAAALFVWEPRSRRPSMIAIGAMGLIGIAFLSAIWSVDPTRTLRYAATLVPLFCAGYVLTWRFRMDGARDQFVGSAITVAAIVLGPTAILAVRDGPTLYMNGGIPRFSGILDNPNWGGLMAALSLPLALWWAIERHRVLGTLAVVAIAAGLMLSGHRTSYLAFGVSVLLLLPRRHTARALGVLGGLGAVILLLFAPGGMLSGTVSAAFFRIQNPLTGRELLWQMATDYIAHRPILGFGFGTENIIQGIMVTEGVPYQISASFHNSFLGLAVQIGPALALAFFAGLAAITFRRRTRELARVAMQVRAARATLAAGLIICIGESWIYSVGNGVTLIFYGALFLVMGATTARMNDQGSGLIPRATRGPAEGPRLLYTCQTYHPYHVAGGPAAKVRALARELHAHGARVTIVTLFHGRRGGWEEVASRASRIPGVGWGVDDGGVQVIYLRPLLRYRRVGYAPAIHAIADHDVKHHDAVHIFGLYDLLGPFVAAGARATRIPYVVEPLGMMVPRQNSRRLKRAFHRVVSSKMLAGASRLVASSPNERRDLITSALPEDAITVRSNGVDAPPAPLPERGSLRREIDIGDATPLILYVGRIARIKTLDILVEAVARQPDDVHLALIGPDDGDGARQAIVELVDRLGVAHRVHLLPARRGVAKWAALVDATVFVLPSLSESFGNAAAEAVVAGVPVIVTQGCGIAPLVAGSAGLVVPHDATALAKAIERVVLDPALRAKLRAGAAELAPTLSWEGPVRQTEQIYREIREH